MANSISAVVTGKTGPAVTLTAISITGIRSASLDAASQVWHLQKSDGTFLDVDASANTTSTLTYSGGVYTLTLS